MATDLFKRAHKFYLNGNVRKAEDCCKLSIANDAGDYESYNILAVIAIDSEKFGLAHTYLKKALEISPAYAEGYHNLGVLYMKNLLNEDAKICFKKAVELNPAYAEPCYNLGWIYSKEKKHKEALYYYEMAINNKPDYALAYNNVGHIIATEDVNKASEYFKKAIEINPLLPEAHINNLWVICYTQGVFAWRDAIVKCLQLKSHSPVQLSYLQTMLGICKWVLGEAGDYKNILENARVALAHNINEFLHKEAQSHNMFKDMFAYNIFLVKLMEWYQAGSNINDSQHQILYFIGESHSLTCANQLINLAGNNYLCKTSLIPACKLWNLINEENSKYKIAFYRELNAIPNGSKVVITFGEVDCRADSGIFRRYLEGKSGWSSDVDSLVSGYFKNILIPLVSRGLVPFVWGVPAPSVESVNKLPIKYRAEYIKFIIYMNQQLKIYCQLNNVKFIDNHKITNAGAGVAHADVKLDPYHLKPDVFVEALQAALS